jgi:signal transduction histidine kinase
VPLRHRLAAVGVVTGLLTATVVQTTLVGVRRVRHATDAVDNIVRAQRLHQHADMMHDALRADVLSAVLVADGVNTRVEVTGLFEGHERKFRRDLAANRALPLHGPIEKDLAALRGRLTAYITDAEALLATAFRDPAQARREFPQFQANFIALEIPQEQITAQLARIRGATEDRLTRSQVWEVRFIIGASVLALLGVVLMVVVMRRMVKPISALAAAAESLGGGDFSVRTPPCGIPELDEVSIALNRTAERLGALVQRERAFSAHASHQLRTPVTGLRVRLEHMLESLGAVDREEVLRNSISLIDRLQRTIEHLLAVARDVPVSREPLDVDGLVRSTGKLYEELLATRGRRLRIWRDDDLPTVAASQPAVTQILDVLLSNALVHGEGMVTVDLRDMGAGLCIEVRDEGPPIAGDPDTLFVRRSDSRTGHGIGLALARALAEAEGGRLIVRRTAAHPTFALMLLAADAERAA